MTKLRHFLLLGALVALAGAQEARAASTTYGIQVNIFDLTTATDLGTTTIFQGGALDTSTDPNKIAVNATAFSGAGALSLTGLNSFVTVSAGSTTLGVGGTAQIIGSTDEYRLTVVAAKNDFLTPSAINASATLTQSSGGNFSNTSAGGAPLQQQQFTNYYNNSGTLFNASGQTPGTQLINVPNTPNSNMNISSNSPGMTGIAGYAVPYQLAEKMVLILQGNPNNPADQFQGSSTITTQIVPEPASLVLMLTGIPVPLTVLGLLRRRKAATKN